jgi:hypothetical protein
LGGGKYPRGRRGHCPGKPSPPFAKISGLTLRLVVAPRHVERAGEIVRFFSERGLRAGLSCVSRRVSGELIPADVLVLDTVGELAEVYGIASVVFVGGSLVRRSGQNPLGSRALGRAPSCSDLTWTIFAKSPRSFARIMRPWRSPTASELRRAVDGFGLALPSREALRSVLARTLADSQRGALEANLCPPSGSLGSSPGKIKAAIPAAAARVDSRSSKK